MVTDPEDQAIYHLTSAEGHLLGAKTYLEEEGHTTAAEKMRLGIKNILDDLGEDVGVEEGDEGE